MRFQAKDIAIIDANTFKYPVSIEEPMVINGDMGICFRYQLPVQIYPALTLLRLHRALSIAWSYPQKRAACRLICAVRCYFFEYTTRLPAFATRTNPVRQAHRVPLFLDSPEVNLLYCPCRLEMPPRTGPDLHRRCALDRHTRIGAQRKGTGGLDQVRSAR